MNRNLSQKTFFASKDRYFYPKKPTKNASIPIAASLQPADALHQMDGTDPETSGGGSPVPPKGPFLTAIGHDYLFAASKS